VWFGILLIHTIIERSSAMDPVTHYVGLDVHAQSITAAILVANSQVPEVIQLSSDLMHVRRLFRRLADQGPVRACYEPRALALFSSVCSTAMASTAKSSLHPSFLAGLVIAARPTGLMPSCLPGSTAVDT
jgi:hypothetical protein